MLLKDKYYKVLSETRTDENSAVFHCALLADCDVYRGHFPHKLVSPGVCNIEMIKECAQMLIAEVAMEKGNEAGFETDNETSSPKDIESLKISTIKQCRLTAVATPEVCPEVDVTLSVTPTEDSFSIVASIKGAPIHEDETPTEYMTFKGELSAENVAI